MRAGPTDGHLHDPVGPCLRLPLQRRVSVVEEPGLFATLVHARAEATVGHQMAGAGKRTSPVETISAVALMALPPSRGRVPRYKEAGGWLTGAP